MGLSATDLIKSTYMATLGIADGASMIGKDGSGVSPKHAFVYALSNVLVRDVARRIGSNLLFGESEMGTVKTVFFIWGVGTVGGMCLNRLLGRVSKRDHAHLDEASLMNSGFSSLLFLIISGSIANEVRKNQGQCPAIY